MGHVSGDTCQETTEIFSRQTHENSLVKACAIANPIFLDEETEAIIQRRKVDFVLAEAQLELKQRYVQCHLTQN